MTSSIVPDDGPLQALKACPATVSGLLVRLDLADNTLGTEGGEILAEALASQPRLLFVDLRDCALEVRASSYNPAWFTLPMRVACGGSFVVWCSAACVVRNEASPLPRLRLKQFLLATVLLETGTKNKGEQCHLDVSLTCCCSNSGLVACALCASDQVYSPVSRW